MKKLLSIILALGLILGIGAVRASAAEPEDPPASTVNWDEFYIVAQPVSDLEIFYGDSFTLSVEVSVPEGADIKYQWFCYNELIEGATGPVLRLGPKDPGYPWEPDSSMSEIFEFYHCRITGYDEGDVNNTKTLETGKSCVAVGKEPSLLLKLYGITIGPFMPALGAVIGISFWTAGLAIPFAPIVFLIALIYYYGYGFSQLF